MSVKLAAGELYHDIRRSSFDRESLSFWMRRVIPIQFEQISLKFEGNPFELLEAYALAFCLTRADDRTMIHGQKAEKFLEKISCIGLGLNTISGLHGAALKRAANYESLAQNIYLRLMDHFDDETGMKPALSYLYNRYVGHQRRHSEKTGFTETPSFTTVPTHEFAVRNNGSIWTYSLQKCIAYIFVSPTQIGLGHWPFAGDRLAQNQRTVQELAASHNWESAYVFARRGREFVKFDNIPLTLFESPDDKITSVGIVTEGSTCNIMLESHSREESELPLGPTILMPRTSFTIVQNLKLDKVA